MANGEFKFAERRVVTKLDDAVLAQSHMKDLANVPMSRYVGWFHNIVASGGCMQYQFNQLMLELHILGGLSFSS